MDFIFSEEQQQLRDSLQKYINKEYGFEARKAIMTSKLGYSEKVWAQFAEMGLLGVAFAEAYGGFGGSAGSDCGIRERPQGPGDDDASAVGASYWPRRLGFAAGASSCVTWPAVARPVSTS